MSASQKTFNKMPLANRGAITCLVIRSFHDRGIASIAVHSDPDGDAITPFYDPMVAQMNWFGADRNDAIANASRGLESIAVRGIRTNHKFLKNVLRHSSFIEGELNTESIDAHGPALLESRPLGKRLCSA